MGLFSKKSSDTVKEAAEAVRKLSMSDKPKEEAKPAPEPKVEAEPEPQVKAEANVEEPAAVETIKDEKGESLLCSVAGFSSACLDELTPSRRSR